MNTILRLGEAYAEALQTIEPTDGNWTVSRYTGSNVNVGRVELKSGKMALVVISIEADEDEIEDTCENFEDLLLLDYVKPLKDEQATT